MRFTLTVEDATAEEIAALVAGLPGPGSRVVGSTGPTATMPTLTPPPLAAPAPLPMPSSGEPAGEDDEDEQDDAPAGLAPPERDSKGLPWDARIHSSSKGLKADGSWRALKGVNKAIVPAIEAELRAAAGAAPQPAPPPVMPPPVQPAPLAMPPAVAPAPVSPPPVAAPAPAPMPMPSPAGVVAPTAPQIAPPAGAFGTFMSELMPQMQRHSVPGYPDLDATYLAMVCTELNTAFGLEKPLTVFTDIAGQPREAELCSYARQIMQRDIIPGTTLHRWQ